MSLWKIAFRSIQQRSLASLLTSISMALGVTLVIAVLTIHAVVGDSFRNNAGLGYNMIVGAKGGKLQLVLNTVYYLSSPVENIPYSYYKEFTDGKFKLFTEYAVPVCLGDYYLNYRVVGTTPAMFNDLSYGDGKKYVFSAGENFRHEDYFAAVIGATVAKEANLSVGSKFNPTHGEGGHAHDPFTVVGVLAPTGTPNDRALFVNMEGFYMLADHAKPVEAKPAEAKAAEAKPAESTPTEQKPDDLFDDAAHRDHDHADHDEHAHDEQMETDEHADHEHALEQEHGDHDHADEPAAAANKPASIKDRPPSEAEHDVQDDHEHADGDHEHAADSPPTPEDDNPRPPQCKAPAAAGSDHDHDEHDHDHADDDHDEHSHHDHDHAGHDHAGHDHADHHDHTPLPEEQREVTAILVRTVNDAYTPSLRTAINEGPVAQSVLPILEITRLFQSIVDPLQMVLLGLTITIVIVSGISILVSIYNSMSDRRHEIAVMRALGARRRTVMSIVLFESILLSLFGGVLGWLLGHAMVAALSPYITAQTGVSVGFFQLLTYRWVIMDGRYTLPIPYEVLIIVGLTALASLVGFLPAMAAYRTDVSKALSSAP